MKHRNLLQSMLLLVGSHFVPAAGGRPVARRDELEARMTALVFDAVARLVGELAEVPRRRPPGRGPAGVPARGGAMPARAPLDESTIPVYSTEGTTCVVHFVHANEVYGFLTQPNGTWMDVWGVVDGFDSFMRAHGRSERAYCLADPPSWNGEYLLFLTAPLDRFGEIAARLRLPLRQREG